MERISVWWIGERSADIAMLEDARVSVERVFGVTAHVERAHERPTGTFDARRGQHLSAAILAWLEEQRPAHTAKVLGITDVDLFIPILTFVFGEAKLGGDVAVVSTARLRANGEPDASSVAERLVKEAIHELGHTFGLIHCADPRCVMARSASVAHVDAKRAALCGDCRIRLRDLGSSRPSSAPAVDGARILSASRPSRTERPMAGRPLKDRGGDVHGR